MKRHTRAGRYLIGLLFVVSSLAARLDADSSDALRFSGSAGVHAKYNSNLDLKDEKSTGLKRKDAFISEPVAALKMAKSWGRDWWLDVDLFTQANFHAQHTNLCLD
jgi:hypothetical protein